jgi:hypothetical protein
VAERRTGDEAARAGGDVGDVLERAGDVVRRDVDGGDHDHLAVEL